MANTFYMRSNLIDEKLAHENKLPNFYKRHADYTFALVPDLTAATDFLSILNDARPAIQFTMETAVNNSLPFAGMVITKTSNHLNTSVYRKKDQQMAFTQLSEPCGHYRHKRSLIRTMLGRAKRLSSSPDLFQRSEICLLLAQATK